MSSVAWLSVALFAAGEAAIFLAVGPASWPLLVAWALGALVVLLGARLVHGRLPRSIWSGLLMPACLLLVFEGGLFFLPAAVAVFLAAVRDGRTGRPLRLHHGR
jgi:hypothetical protein